MLITFEGIDGSGKTTQSRKLYKFLKEKGYRVRLYREPGGTQAGETIRELVIRHEICVRTELLLFEASRAELIERKVKPALQSGEVVILDRFIDSTLAYQSYGRGIDIATVRSLNEFASHGIKPELTFLLDIDPELSLRRVKEGSRFDDIAFLRRVREGFIDISKGERDRVVVLRSDIGENELFGKILEELKSRFPEKFDF